MKIEREWFSDIQLGHIILRPKNGEVLAFAFKDAAVLDDIKNIGDLCYKFGLREANTTNESIQTVAQTK